MIQYFWMGFLLLAETGFCQDVKETGKAGEAIFDEPPSWDVTCEVFSLSLPEAARLKRLRQTDEKDYAELVRRVESGQAKLEEFKMMRAVEGEATKSEEISEMTYATEFTPPELPNEIGKLSEEIEKAKMLISPASPTAFDTRNVGSTMEVKLHHEAGDSIELESTLSLVSYVGRQVWGQGMAEVEMPRFAVQRVKTALKLKPDSATLMGSISPPEALQPKDGERQVWLAFVAVSKSKE